ncbi:MAG TPA: indolepyruvate oxidoreductase subunit beta [Desulfatiglandales bacterium]|nr:indolepyruvate oxidoreductase subunit beta [Desulfatiglandales bacterium]
MNTVNIVLCGLGGQGILFMTKVLSWAAVNKGLNILGAETHGMAQRGGSVTSHLRLGDVESSLVRAGTAHFLISLDDVEAYRNLPFLAKGAEMYVNASSELFPEERVRLFLDSRRITYRTIPAEKMAQELGAPLSSNLALLGYFSAFRKGPLTYKSLRTTIEEISPDPFKEINFTIFDAGYKRGIEETRE